jgi:hypothetical protein
VASQAIAVEKIAGPSPSHPFRAVARTGPRPLMRESSERQTNPAVRSRIGTWLPNSASLLDL